MEITFPINPLLQSMSYTDSILRINFIVKGKIIIKRYSGCPANVAYSWFYKTTAKEVLSYYAKNIRKKFTVIKETNQLIIKL